MSLLRIAALAGLAALCVSAAGATTPPPGGDTPPRAAEDAQNAPVVRGFRSAAFGMDESAVRRAIFDDFAVAGNAVARTRNDLEQSTVLTVTVPDLVPDAGPATVGYVLGRGGTLIQVTILWGLDERSGDADALEATARILIDFFDEQGFTSQTGPEPVVFVDGSNLLYYARDAEGGGLALSALPRQGAADPATASPILRLAYAADLANPDVFRTPAITP